MSKHQHDRRKNRVLPLLMVGGGAWYVLTNAGPLLSGAEINVICAMAAFILLACAMTLASDGFWYLGNHFDRLAARTPGDNKGTAAFARSRAELAPDLLEAGWGPYWGTFQGEELMADYASNAMTVGTAGSGKGVGVVQPTILSIRESKTVVDFKSELTCVLAGALRKRGEKVHILNIGDVNADIVGESASYNPLCVIADNFWRPGGLQDVSDDVHEITMQLAPEPASAAEENNDNSFFRVGSRDLIGFAIQMCVLVNGYNATLGDVAELLNDKDALLRHAQWACGRLEQTSSGEGVA